MSKKEVREIELKVKATGVDKAIKDIKALEKAEEKLDRSREKRGKKASGIRKAARSSRSRSYGPDNELFHPTTRNNVMFAPGNSNSKEIKKIKDAKKNLVNQSLLLNDWVKAKDKHTKAVDEARNATYEASKPKKNSGTPAHKSKTKTKDAVSDAVGLGQNNTMKSMSKFYRNQDKQIKAEQKHVVNQSLLLNDWVKAKDKHSKAIEKARNAKYEASKPKQYAGASVYKSKVRTSEAANVGANIGKSQELKSMAKYYSGEEKSSASSGRKNDKASANEKLAKMKGEYEAKIAEIKSKNNETMQELKNKHSSKIAEINTKKEKAKKYKAQDWENAFSKNNKGNIVSKRKSDSMSKYYSNQKQSYKQEKVFSSRTKEQRSYGPEFKNSAGAIPKIKPRQKLNKRKGNLGDLFAGGTDKVSNSIMGAVGKLTMLAGAVTMIGYMASQAIATILSIGDGLGVIQGNAMAGEGFRSGLNMSERAGFDSANSLNQKYSGLDSFSSGAMVARAGSSIRESGGSVGGKNLSNLVTSAHGAAALTGQKTDATMGIVAQIAKDGKGLEKLGLSDKTTKLTKNMDANLEIIAKAMLDNGVASSALNGGTIATSMQMIKSSPAQLAGEVYSKHKEQMNMMFSALGEVFMATAMDPDVVNAWSATLSNLEDTLGAVFTPEAMKETAIGMAEWSAELINFGGHMVKGFMWISQNSDSIINGMKSGIVLFGVAKLITWGVKLKNFILDAKALAGDISGIIKGDAIKNAMTKFSTYGKDLAKFVSSNSKVVGGISAAIGAYMMISDGLKGAEWAKTQEGISTGAGAVGFALGGEGKGASGAMHGVMKGGAIGAAIGSIVPVVGTALGAAVGAAIGGIFGYIGGENMSKIVQGFVDIHVKSWKIVGDVFMSMWDGIFNIFSKIKDKVLGFFKKEGEEPDVPVIPKIGDEKSLFPKNNVPVNPIGPVDLKKFKIPSRLNTPINPIGPVDVNKFKLSESLDKTMNANGANQPKKQFQPLMDMLGGNGSSQILVIQGDVNLDSTTKGTEQQMIGLAGVS